MILMLAQSASRPEVHVQFYNRKSSAREEGGPRCGRAATNTWMLVCRLLVSFWPGFLARVRHATVATEIKGFARLRDMV